MRRFSLLLVGAAVSLAMVASAAPAQAASLRAAPAVMTSDSPVADVQTVHDRRSKRRHRDHFSFGFSFPFVYHPYAYSTYRCPYGYTYDYRYGCVAYQPYYAHPYYYRSRPGVRFEFGF